MFFLCGDLNSSSIQRKRCGNQMKINVVAEKSGLKSCFFYLFISSMIFISDSQLLCVNE